MNRIPTLLSVLTLSLVTLLGLAAQELPSAPNDASTPVVTLPAPVLESGNTSENPPAPGTTPSTAWLAVSYFGEMLTHPGVTVALEFPVVEDGGSVLALGPQLGVFYQAGNSSTWFADCQLTFRHVFEGGFLLGTSFGLGYAHSFVDGTVYEVSGGQLQTVVDYGQPGVFASLSLFIGGDLNYGAGRQLLLYAKPTIAMQYPYSQFILPRFAAEVGLSIGL